MNRIEQFQKVQKEGLELFKQKNADYGDSFIVYGMVGVLIRMQDKINRLVNITNTNISVVKNESLRDTLLDLHNYSALALLLFDEKK
jgi:hypothetical protein